MKYRNLLIASVLSVIMPAAVNTLNAQQDNTVPHNNVIMNTYTYTPVLYQQGTSTSGMRMYPNPARNNATVYINSIKDRDNGEIVIFNNNGTPVYKNILRTGNNNINVGRSIKRHVYRKDICKRQVYIYR